jgi:pyridoxamine 5'-phosphate oxidase
MSIDKEIQSLRREYNHYKFDEKSALPNPVDQFRIWFEDAVQVSILDPNAFVLATASKDSKPSARMLLLKKYDNRGFSFYTNYSSRKGKDLEENPFGSMLFFWDKLERQVRIKGRVEKLSFEESDEYFQTRPYTTKLGAWASRQSESLASRFTLIRRVAKKMMRYPVNVPLPPFWGGYRLVPDSFEFWQGRDSRLHDRLVYSLDNGIWKIHRLYP